MKKQCFWAQRCCGELSILIPLEVLSWRLLLWRLFGMGEAWSQLGQKRLLVRPGPRRPSPNQRRRLGGPNVVRGLSSAILSPVGSKRPMLAFKFLDVSCVFFGGCCCMMIVSDGAFLLFFDDWRMILTGFNDLMIDDNDYCSSLNHLMTQECHLKDLMESAEPMKCNRSFLNGLNSGQIRLGFFAMLRKGPYQPLDSQLEANLTCRLFHFVWQIWHFHYDARALFEIKRTEENHSRKKGPLLEVIQYKWVQVEDICFLSDFHLMCLITLTDPTYH